MLPADVVAGESALAPERMSAAWLRQRFAVQPATRKTDLSGMIDQMGCALRKQQSRLPFMHEDWNQDRSQRCRSALLHALNSLAIEILGMPRRMERSDTSPVEAALREAEEEIRLMRR